MATKAKNTKIFNFRIFHHKHGYVGGVIINTDKLPPRFPLHPNRCLIEKCDPTVTWRGEDGKKKELGWLLLGNGTRNYAVWSVKVEEWRRNKDREPGLPDAGPQPTSSSLVGPREEWLAEFGEVAVALGISTVAVGPAVAVAVGPAVVFPAAALGPVFWMVRF